MLHLMFMACAAEAASLTVTALANGDSNVRFGGTCFCGPRFHSDGDEYEYTSTGGSVQVGVSGTNWLTNGDAADVWVESILTAGTWSSGSTGVRLQLSANRLWNVQKSGGGNKQVTGYFKFWDAASGGSLLQQTDSAVWTANSEVF